MPGRGPAGDGGTAGGVPLRVVVPAGARNDPGAASTRGYLKVGPGGPWPSPVDAETATQPLPGGVLVVSVFGDSTVVVVLGVAPK